LVATAAWLAKIVFIEIYFLILLRDWGTKDVFPLRCQRLTLSRWGLHLQQDYKASAAGSVERKQPMADDTCENVTGYENFVGLSVSFSNSTNFCASCVCEK